MKKVLMMLMLVAVMLFSTGCFTDKAYDAGKKVYPAVKAGVQANSHLLSEGTREKLKTVDKAVTSYDKTRTEVKKALESKDK